MRYVQKWKKRYFVFLVKFLGFLTVHFEIDFNRLKYKHKILPFFLDGCNEDEIIIPIVTSNVGIRQKLTSNHAQSGKPLFDQRKPANDTYTFDCKESYTHFYVLILLFPIDIY